MKCYNHKTNRVMYSKITEDNDLKESLSDKWNNPSYDFPRPFVKLLGVLIGFWKSTKPDKVFDRKEMIKKLNMFFNTTREFSKMPARSVISIAKTNSNKIGSYVLGRKIGEGVFGKVFEIKGIPNMVMKIAGSSLFNEYNVYRQLQGIEGIMNLKRRAFISEGGRCGLILDKLGKTLEEVTFVDGDVDIVMRYLIRVVKNIHQRNWLLRDIKPDNIMITKNPKEDPSLWIIDLGLCCKKHTFIGKKNISVELTGTPRFASIAQHSSGPYEAYDDLISLGYMYVLFSIGKLPWDNVSTEADLIRLKKDFDVSKLPSMKGSGGGCSLQRYFELLKSKPFSYDDLIECFDDHGGVDQLSWTR